MQLKLIIENIDLNEFSAPSCSNESDFIDAALHAAKYSKAKQRAEILKDISLLLNCKSEDLNFLFQVSLDKAVPQNYKLDLPDYRKSDIYFKSDIYLEAAE